MCVYHLIFILTSELSWSFYLARKNSLSRSASVGLAITLLISGIISRWEKTPEVHLVEPGTLFPSTLQAGVTKTGMYVEFGSWRWSGSHYPLQSFSVWHVDKQTQRGLASSSLSSLSFPPVQPSARLSVLLTSRAWATSSLQATDPQGWVRDRSSPVTLSEFPVRGPTLTA